MRSRVSRWARAFCCLALGVGIAASSPAEVVFDGSLGEPGVAPTRPFPATGGIDYQIQATRGHLLGGSALFHSFARMDLETGSAATFEGPASVENVFARVTSGTPSFIDGALRSGMPFADLYLLNPAGLVFGPGARLDLGGAFHASTADTLRFGDGAAAQFFDASLDGRVPGLAVAAPSAFGFLGAPAPIDVQGAQLAVSPGQHLSLVGGDLFLTPDLAFTVASSLQAADGRIDLVSVASGGEVIPGVVGGGRAPDLSSFAAFGEVSLLFANVDVAGDTGGTVFIRGGRLVVDRSQLSADAFGFAPPADPSASKPGIDIAAQSVQILGGGLFSGTSGGARGGDIRLRAAELLIAGARLDTSVFDLLDGGRGGDILLEARNLTIQGGTALVSQTPGTVRGGDIRLTGSDVAIFEVPDELTGTLDTSVVGAFSGGRGGDIVVDAFQLSLDQARLASTTFGTADGGHISLGADDALVLFSQIDTSVGFVPDFGPLAGGRAGDVTLAARSLRIGGSSILSRTTGAVDGGNLTLRAQDLQLSGLVDAGGNPAFATLDTSVSGPFSGGRAGAIDLRASRLTLESARVLSTTPGGAPGGDLRLSADDAVLRFSTLDTSVLQPDGVAPPGGGAGGGIALDVGTLMLASSLVQARTPGHVDGGSISVHADRAVLEDSRLDTNVSGMLTGGRGGSIFVEADDLAVRSSALQSVTTGMADAGEVHIQARTARFEDRPGAGADPRLRSRIDTRVCGNAAEDGCAGSGAGRGGDIRLEVGSLTLTDGARFLAGTPGPHLGGSIRIQAEGDVLLEDAAQLDTSAFLLPELLPEGAVVELESGLLFVPDASLLPRGGRGGDIRIAARNLTLDEATIFSTAFGAAPGGDVQVDVEEALSIRGVRVDPSLPGGALVAGIHAETFGLAPDADAGGIEVDARTVTLESGGAIDSSSLAGSLSLSDGSVVFLPLGSGGGGRVRVEATESIRLAGRAPARPAGDPAGIFSDVTDNAGPGGSLLVAAPRIVLDDGAIAADSFSRAATASSGRIDVRTRSLELRGGSFISTTTFGEGDAGRIRVEGMSEGTFADRVMLTGAGSRLSSDSFGAESGGAIFGDGDGGDIDVRAQTVELFDRASIEARSVGLAGPGGARGAGAGGNVRLRVDTLRMTDGAGISASTGFAQGSFASGGSGRGGSIDIGGRRGELRRGAFISAESAGRATGNAGDISLRFADELLLHTDSAIVARAANANGGNVTLEVGELIDVLRSRITANVGDFTGGNIDIDPDVVVLDRSQIVAQAGNGRGGAITLTAGGFLVSPGSLVSASAGPAGIAGTVEINSPEVDIAGTITTLPETFLDASGLLRERCATRREGAGGSFVVGGGQGLPPLPDGALPSFPYRAAGPAGDDQARRAPAPLWIALGGGCD